MFTNCEEHIIIVCAQTMIIMREQQRADESNRRSHAFDSINERLLFVWLSDYGCWLSHNHHHYRQWPFAFRWETTKNDCVKSCVVNWFYLRWLCNNMTCNSHICPHHHVGSLSLCHHENRSMHRKHKLYIIYILWCDHHHPNYYFQGNRDASSSPLWHKMSILFVDEGWTSIVDNFLSIIFLLNSIYYTISHMWTAAIAAVSPTIFCYRPINIFFVMQQIAVNAFKWDLMHRWLCTHFYW